jgi:hypothetical protein
MEENFMILMPASAAAKRRGCSCSMSADSQFKADPACSIHGVAIFKRLLKSPDAKAAIERFRRCIDATSGAPDQDWIPIDAYRQHEVIDADCPR